jgi:4-carboxymuconolactone decarboxylase
LEFFVAQPLPNVYQKIVANYPEIAAAHDAMAAAVEGVGPLDKKTCSLVKIGISVGAGLESAVRSHCRRAAEAGASREEIVQAIFQGMNTIGFPRTVAAWSWAQVQFDRDDESK